MDDRTRQRIVEAHFALPEGCRSPPASEDRLQAFEREFGPIPADYRWYLSACGGGVVGPEWIDDIDELARTHRKFRKEWGPPRGWTMADVFVVGWDGWGNPYGIHVPTGRLLVEDHDFGGIHVFAGSLETFLLEGLRIRDAE